MNVYFLRIATLFYLVGSLLYLYYIAFLKDKAASWGKYTLIAGCGIHFIGFVFRYFEAGFTPITNLFESLSFFSLSIMFIFLIVEGKYKLKVIGAFAAPIAFIFILFSAFISADIQMIPPALQSYWLPVHVTLLFLGDAIFAVAFAVGIIYLIQ